MRIRFYIMRESLTGTSVEIDIHPISKPIRWILSTSRMSGCDTNKYHYLAYTDKCDISSTDMLEEMSSTSRMVFKIINKRVFFDAHMELDLEKCQSL